MGMSSGTDSSTSDEPTSPHWQQVQTLGVAEVVMTILEARKTMPSATAAAVSYERHGGGYRVRVRLTDGTPPPEDPDDIEGTIAIFVARQLGNDLADAFGDKDVIILK